jgi:Ribonuclease G/E
MHVVDVNSGTSIKKENDQEANALETNLGAADELARQLRLRDMGGIIIVDFIDMKLPEDRQMLYERMCKNMQKDRAKHNILPLSKFGLMQITRQRVRPAMSVNVEEVCPTCFGKGTIKSSFLFTDTLENKIDNLVNKIGIKKFYLHVHPYVAAYINKGVFSMKLPEDRQMLYERMCKNMQKDRAKHNILPLSKFGLMQITRQRVRPAMSVNVEETCPTCFGKGTIKSSFLFTDTLENKIDNLVNKIGIKKFYLHVHPYVAAYINKGVFSLKMQWQMKYGLGVRVIPSQKLAFLQYEFYDADKQFIDMQEETDN